MNTYSDSHQDKDHDDPHPRQPQQSQPQKSLQQMGPQTGGGGPGGRAGAEFSANTNHLDLNWASNFLMNHSQDMLYDMEYSGAQSAGPAQDGANEGMLQYLSVPYPSQMQDHQQIHSQPPIGAPQHISQLQQQNAARNRHSVVKQDASQLHQPQQQQQHIQQQQLQLQLQQQPQVSRAKVKRPCDHCRRRKTKCVIIPGTNNCAQCEAKSLVCTYIDQPSKKSQDELDGYGNAKRAKLGHDSNTNLVLLQGNDMLGNDNKNGHIIPPNVIIRDVPPVQDYSMVNNSLLKKTLSLQFPRSSFYVGPTSYLYDINLLNLVIDSQNPNHNNTNNAKSDNNGKIEQINLSSSISLRKVSEKAQFVLKDDQSPQSYLAMSHDVDMIEKFIAPHGQILIDLYFRIIHPSYPILHKKVFLEKYSRTHREFSAPLLAAVYVLAIQWWDYDPQLNQFPKPNSEIILKIAINNYLSEILKRPKLSAVQAGLLLLQCKHILLSQNLEKINNTAMNNMNGGMNDNSSNSDADFNDWVLCSQVVSLAEELGLGLDCHGWKLPKWERGLRKRLAWAVYMEDKWLSLKNARPSHINDINWVVMPLADEDFPEKHGDGDLKEGSSDIDNGKKIFRNLIDLSTVLSDIMNQFYSMRAMNELNDIHQVLKLAKPLQLRLRNWYHSLPIELQMSSVQPRKLCSNGYLQLAYFATELTLHRKIITTIYQQLKLDANSPHKELITVCRTAARTRLLASIEFVRDLKPEHIHSFWHSSSASSFTLIGTFAAILFISSTSREEEEFYKEQVFNYRWILKISSKGFDQVGFALQQLDLVLNHIPGLLIDKIGLPMVVPNVPTIDYKQRLNNNTNNNNNSSSLLNNNNNSNNSNLSKSKPQTPVSQGALPVRARPRTSSNPPQGRNTNLSFVPSPQQYNSPIQQTTAQTLSRNGNFMVNSPQSSQGLSPKDTVKQQRSLSGSGLVSSIKQKEDQLSNSGFSHTHGSSAGSAKPSPAGHSPMGPLTAPAEDNISVASENN